jgi:ribonucleoside-diphosphate reductase alpha chain
VNTSYNPQHYEDEKIPMSEMLKHIVLAYKYGMKQLYYFNVYDGQGEIDLDKLDKDSAPKTISEEDDSCDSCKI